VPVRWAHTAGGLLDKLKDRLKGGHFRQLNESLYTTSYAPTRCHSSLHACLGTLYGLAAHVASSSVSDQGAGAEPAPYRGDAAFEMFSKAPALFDQYHDGFRHMAAKWPLQPIDVRPCGRRAARCVCVCVCV
jgi:hypothetical protein